MRKPLPSRDLLISLLTYEEETGKLFWKARDASLFSSARAAKLWNARFSGKEAGTLTPRGYVDIGILGRNYRSHRLIVKMKLGMEPDLIDHDNGKPWDNSWTNIMIGSPTSNSQNQKTRADNTSGFSGVSRYGREKRWQARITVAGKVESLGYFDTPEMAYAAKREAERLHGFNSNHGRSGK